MTDNRTKGRFGEQAAADLLVSKGYRIVKRNYYTRGGEIDIIAENGKVIVFCEVKARRNDESSLQYGRPASAVGKRKQESVAEAPHVGMGHGQWTAQTYLFEHPSKLTPRLDVIEIYFSTFTDIEGGIWYAVDKTEHFENAFFASSRSRFGQRDRRLL